MRNKLPAFTDEQVHAMQESEHIISALDEATRDYIITYDPATDDSGHPNLISMDKIWAEMKMASRTIKLELPDEPASVSFNRCFDKPSSKDGPKRFGQKWRTFREPQYAPYRELDVVYEGLITLRLPERRHISHTVYSIHQPNGLLHRLGLVTCSVEEFRRELVPIEPASGLDNMLKIARQRLRHIAASAPETKEGEHYEAVADNSQRQTHIETSGFYPVGPATILDAESAIRLAHTIRQAMTHGTDVERG